MKFILDNLYLFAIALASGGMLLWPLVKRGGGSASVSPLEATQLINHRNAIVIDVRDEQAFAAGSVTGARNLPFAKLTERIAELTRFKARPAIVVCESGQQSSRALAILKAQGFEETHALAGGLSAWKQAGLPLVQATRDGGRSASRDGGNSRERSGASGGTNSAAKSGATGTTKSGKKNEARAYDKARAAAKAASRAAPPPKAAALNGASVHDDGADVQADAAVDAKAGPAADALDPAKDATTQGRVKEVS